MKRGVTERRFWTDCLPRLEHMVMIVLPLSRRNGKPAPKPAAKRVCKKEVPVI
jgi:hypothetical protein